jgi:hypothetical protein
MRNLSIASGIVLLTAFGVGVTELAMASGNQSVDQPPARHSVATSPSPSTQPSPSATPQASHTPLPSPSPGLATATTNGFVHLRAGTSTSTADLADLQAATTVELTGSAVGLWQPVRYQGINGFIYTPYLNY